MTVSRDSRSPLYSQIRREIEQDILDKKLVPTIDEWTLGNETLPDFLARRCGLEFGWQGLVQFLTENGNRLSYGHCLVFAI